MASLPEITEKLDDLAGKVSDLATDMAALVRACNIMNTTLGTHSESLANIMAACSEEEDGAPELHDALVEIAHKMDQQNDLLRAIGGNLHGLGPTIQAAVIQGFSRVLTPVSRNPSSPVRERADEDGVIHEDDAEDDDGHGHAH